jgi:hypothetical protein
MKSTYEPSLTADVATHGGEQWIGDIEVNEYGITIGDLSISGIQPDAFCALAVEMVNHARANGRVILFGPDHAYGIGAEKLEYLGKL